MKKLVCAVIVAGSLCATAEEAVKPAVVEAGSVVQASTSASVAPKRMRLTDEQIAQRRAKRDQIWAKRKAEMEAKMIDIIKKYGLDDAKAKALANELTEAMKPARRAK